MTHTKTGCNGLIVFTDLDGTLLDHATYGWAPARPALEALRERGHWLVLASSKTAAEIAPLRADLGFIHCPAIVENGAGILEPGDAAGGFDDTARRRILQALDGLPANLRARFAGFHNWSVAEISARTGLAPDAAQRAATREHSEPGLWSGTPRELEAFTRTLHDAGIVAQQGGRFLTLSFGATKAGRMIEIAAERRAAEGSVLTVALGDAPNDIEMLERADKGFIVRNDSHQGVPPLDGEKSGTIVRSSAPGPSGWNECVLSVVADMTGNAREHDG